MTDALRSSCTPAFNARPDEPDSRGKGPTPECLVNERIPEMDRRLRRRGYPFLVRERAIDRIIQRSLPYFCEGTAESLQTEEERHTWLFGTLFLAASQEASREPPCTSTAPEYLMAVACDDDDVTRERCEKVHIALGELTPAQRDAVYYCVMHDLSLSEAAARMGCSRSTVQTHRNAALRRLRQLLADLSR